VIGIDFGTTNCCAAVENLAGNVETVSLTPLNTPPYDSILSSKVLLSGDGEAIIGPEVPTAFRAMSAAEQDQAVYLTSFKPVLDQTGLKRAITTLEEGDFYYDGLEQVDKRRVVVRRVLIGGPYSRAEVVRAIRELLRPVLERAMRDSAPDEALALGIPVHFSSRARKRLLAGLHATGLFASYKELISRTRFVLEPVAAAAAGMREAFDAKDNELVLVFDHGGGTLDLSLIDFERRGDLPFLIPRRERAFEGSSEVAGAALDEAFRSELYGDRRIRAILEQVNPAEADDYVREAKERLSTSDTAPLTLPGEQQFEVSRELFEMAVLPVVALIQRDVSRLLRDAGLTVGDVDRVLLTGGSSLVPCVQKKVREMFPRLASENRIRAYDPADDGDVERAITEVAQGLIHFGGDENVERLVLWDVELHSSGSRVSRPVVGRGESYDADPDGRPVLHKRIEIPEAQATGAAFGLWERQLERPFFLFGLGDVPRHSGPMWLEITLRPDRLYPALRVVDDAGAVLSRDYMISGWPADAAVAADLEPLPEGQLADFFDQDTLDFLPGSKFEQCRHTPLSVLLSCGDEIEWVIPASPDGPGLSRGRGTIASIRRIDDSERIEKMDSLALDRYVFTVAMQGAASASLHLAYGEVRLALAPPGD
jgi:molecular chaperone DnaK (HSP70)